MRAGFALLAVLSSACCLGAQALQVYSEFTRVDPSGKISGAQSPREILSPAVARNAFASYRVVVTAPPGAPWELHIGQNPEQAVKATLYREVYTKKDGAWIASGLEAAAEPVHGQLAEGQAAQSFWLDLWVARDAPVRRVKVEPQLYLGETWWTYPMEVRVTEATILDKPPGTLREYLCGTAGPALPLFSEPRIRRNMAQDAALARKLEAAQSKAAVQQALRARVPGDWCAPNFAPPDFEWYLKLRDHLLNARSQ